MAHNYNVPAKRGGRIVFDGKPGRITAVSAGHLVVHLDGEPARRRHYTHPCWRMDYLT
jgi:hypothetical protein